MSWKEVKKANSCLSQGKFKHLHLYMENLVKNNNLLENLTTANWKCIALVVMLFCNRTNLRKLCRTYNIGCKIKKLIQSQPLFFSIN